MVNCELVSRGFAMVNWCREASRWWIGVARLRDGGLVSRGFAMVNWCREASRWWIGVAGRRDGALAIPNWRCHKASRW